MAEGSQWEAIQLAAHCRLGNLLGVPDVNRLGQRGETMYGHDLDAYRCRVEAFGWKTLLVEDGNSFDEIDAAYLMRAFDQIRMSQYSEPNLKFVGSHAGVSIGEDGPSQMGLEDLAMFRSLREGIVLYPSDAVSCERLVECAAAQPGIVYLRTTRGS